MTAVAGMERHLLTLLPALAQRGLDVQLLVLTESDKPLESYLAQMRSAGVPTQAVPIRRDLDPSLIAALAARVRGRDAVHTHLIHADLHGVLAAKRAGVRRVYCSAHNDDKFRRLLPVRLLQGWLWRQLTAGIAISEALRRFLITMEFAPPSKIHTVYYGHDPEPLPARSQVRAALTAELNLPADALIVGSVCRLTEQKGITYGLAAFAQAALDCPQAHYVIMGDGPLRGALQAQAVAAGLNDRVHFLGWRPDARALYPALDVFMMPSLWEGFGLVALEAMAASLPIIASAVTALPEIVVANETALLAAPRRVDELATALRALLSNPALRARLGWAGRQRLGSVFSVQRMVEGTLKVYGQGENVSS
jgi:glycosyltransferase involved in cell wall biosynthesis